MKPIDAIRLQLKAMELVEGTELEWWSVVKARELRFVFKAPPNFTDKLEDYELALGIVEGKPVWVGDELYTDTGLRFTVEFIDSQNIFGSQKAGCSVCWKSTRVSWLPPKPKTAMVELLVEDIKVLAELGGLRWYDNLAEACRKTLEQL